MSAGCVMADLRLAAEMTLSRASEKSGYRHVGGDALGFGRGRWLLLDALQGAPHTISVEK
jgi:hypothetical protein